MQLCNVLKLFERVPQNAIVNEMHVAFFHSPLQRHGQAFGAVATSGTHLAKPRSRGCKCSPFFESFTPWFGSMMSTSLPASEGHNEFYFSER